jgi:hypothetical protein
MAADLAQLFLEIALNSPQSVKNITGLQTVNSLMKGSIVQFQYVFSRHDPKPLVLLTNNPNDTNDFPNYLRGLNLHYIGSSQIMNLISVNRMNACGDRSFSWDKVKTNNYIKGSFRIYKKAGVRNLRILDCNYLKRILAASKKLNLQDLTALRSNIEEQINTAINQTAESMIGT